MDSFYFIGIQYTDDNYNEYTGYVETVSTNEIKILYSKCVQQLECE